MSVGYIDISDPLCGFWIGTNRATKKGRPGALTPIWAGNIRRQQDALWATLRATLRIRKPKCHLDSWFPESKKPYRSTDLEKLDSLLSRKDDVGPQLARFLLRG